MKNKQTLQELWKKYVTAFIDSGELPELTRAFHEGLINATSSNIEEVVYGNFLSCKKTMLDLYMKDPQDGIDRHKEGACLIFAIIDANPFMLNPKVIEFYKDWKNKPGNNKNDDGIPYEVLLCTHICAINAAIGYIVSQKVRVNNITKKPEELTFPNTYEQGPYLLSLAIDLYYAQKYKNYDILAISNILFLIEKYFDYSQLVV